MSSNLLLKFRFVLKCSDFSLFRSRMIAPSPPPFWVFEHLLIFWESQEGIPLIFTCGVKSHLRLSCNPRPFFLYEIWTLDKSKSFQWRMKLKENAQGPGIHWFIFESGLGPKVKRSLKLPFHPQPPALLCNPGLSTLVYHNNVMMSSQVPHDSDHVSHFTKKSFLCNIWEETPYCCTQLFDPNHQVSDCFLKKVKAQNYQLKNWFWSHETKFKKAQGNSFITVQSAKSSSPNFLGSITWMLCIWHKYKEIGTAIIHLSRDNF